ncbi:uncharacterized protein UV8b_00981 [Ustilaginoidea virens]|uniref:Uncharacterized protein n=1 Tax=Ustilaginoidea virens TaxID=1159556 RepID=A0A063BSV7_USTVR|nr:uncharacterized protein UV8b_00981 [Ustilaginoidea virens]QUC16740.1 hypothetical protein UV8b_00981 [Ustilaginoidea virens]GAO17974.1 hypothetical protein UVI_02056170 [Ustilaginoidea virens]
MDQKPSPITPLLHHQHPSSSPGAPGPPSVTRLQYLASSAVSALHLLRSLALLAIPNVVLAGFAVPASGPGLVLTTVLGLRDMLLAGLILMADPQRSYEVQRALGVALFSDSIDTFVLIFVVACSSGRRNPVPEIVSVALLAILEHLTLWSFGDDDDDDDDYGRPGPCYQAIVRVDRLEDKRLRLGMWLEDLKRAEQGEQQALLSKSSAHEP